VRRLVVEAKGGDHGAWETLYRRSYPRLLAYATRRLNSERAQDAVAETMARAVACIDRFEWNDGGWDGWLFGILRHVVADAHRVLAKHERQLPSEEPTPGAGPLERVLADEETVAMRVAFAQLGSGDRELLELRVVAGLSSDDVATILGKRAGTVRMAQARALERLRRNLKAQV
jgi:RNA polymerase sigma-70 factor (ECF subfamily)